MGWLTDEEKNSIVALYSQGLSTAKVAAMVGKGVTTVKRAVSGIPKNDYVNHELDNQIGKLYSSGLSVSAVCERLGIKQRRMLNGVKRTGLSIRSIKEQMAIHNPGLGRKHTPEARLLISKAAHQRHEGMPRVQKYRVERDRGVHPVTGLTEKAWVRHLLEKANWTCQITGVRGVSLSVHHLDCVKGFPEKRWDESNVVVVQTKLHKEFHFQFMGNTRKKCTSLDWVAFLTTI